MKPTTREKQVTDWAKIFRLMLEKFRKYNPYDKRSDWDILEDLSEHFVKKGIFKKEKGKYLVPEVEDYDNFIKLLSANNI